ncbi:hypothetical protein AgCh_005718 [Apium graveolens]
MVLQKKPDIVFLCETLCKMDTVEKVKNMIGFEGVVAVDVQGRSGGIALFWRRQDEVQLLSYSRNHIDVVVDIRGWSKFRMTGIYGEPDRIRRSETWNLIKGLKSQSMVPWCLIGDMNNVVKQEDKKGGHSYPSWLIQGFRDTLEECELEDVELTGYPYTWERGHGTESWIEVKLDRALVNKEFVTIFTEVKLTNLELSTLDHSPIFFELAKVVYSVNNKVFTFENAWLREPMCRQIVEEVWNRRKINQIDSLLNDDGQRVGWESGLQDTMVNYFTKLFGASQTVWNHLFECVMRRINHVQNASLLAQVEANEVKKALFSMHPDKSPGPDGMSPGFYQKFWGIVGGDLVEIVHKFFLTGVLEEGMGDSNIVLIPKKKNPVNMMDLRPISLCNVIYKVISKVLANRVKQVLRDLISETQSAFIP